MSCGRSLSPGLVICFLLAVLFLIIKLALFVCQNCPFPFRIEMESCGKKLSLVLCNINGTWSSYLILILILKISDHWFFSVPNPHSAGQTEGIIVRGMKPIVPLD